MIPNRRQCANCRHVIIGRVKSERGETLTTFKCSRFKDVTAVNHDDLCSEFQPTIKDKRNEKR